MQSEKHSAPEKILNVLFVCERIDEQVLNHIRAFAEAGHRFTMHTDIDRAIAEFHRKPFKFDTVIVDLPENPTFEEEA